MKGLLVHGCYDRATLKTLQDLGVENFAFDLRARSPNLIPWDELRALVKEMKSREVTLIFEDDKSSTVLSFLDLLKGEGVRAMLEFRDQRELDFYYSLRHPFLWMFHPEADWKNILLLPELKGVLLPLAWREEYGKSPHLWEVIEQRNLKVFVHAESLAEAASLEHVAGTNVGLDLTGEVEKSYRVVDQERLKKMKLWDKFNEDSFLE